MIGARRLVAVALAASMVVLSACGDDDDDEAAEGGGGATTTSAPAAATAPSAWCDDVVRAQVLEPEVPEDAPPEEQEAAEQRLIQEELLPLLDKIEREAPASAKAVFPALANLFKEKGPDAFEDDAYAPVESRANEAAAQACGATETSVTGVNYAFQGVPPQLEAGYGLFQFTNQGTELHEMILIRKKVGTTESFDQILALEQEEGQEKVDEVGFSFGFPGSPADSTLVKLEPGQYAMVCFIPVGLTPEAAMQAEESGEQPQGPPHFTQGMKQEFRVA